MVVSAPLPTAPVVS